MSRGGRGRLVYSTEQGRADAAATREGPAASRGAGGDGVVRVRREVKGRRGKTVTTIAGVPLDAAALRGLAGELKRRCGSGGAIKDGVIEIQGDHRDAVVEDLRRRGYPVKRAGG